MAKKYSTGFSLVPGASVYVRGAEVVIVGRPIEGETIDGDDIHNCDAMDCGWDHVIGRGTLAQFNGRTEEPS